MSASASSASSRSVGFVFADDKIDLGHLETGGSHLELQICRSQLHKLDLQDRLVPGGVLGKLVVGEAIGLYLRLGEILDVG